MSLCANKWVHHVVRRTKASDYAEARPDACRLHCMVKTGAVLYGAGRHGKECISKCNGNLESHWEFQRGSEMHVLYVQ